MDELESLYLALEKSGMDLRALWFKAVVISDVIHDENTRCSQDVNPELVTLEMMVKNRLTFCAFCSHDIRYEHENHYVRGTMSTLTRINNLSLAAAAFRQADNAQVLTSEHAAALIRALRVMRQDDHGSSGFKLERLLPDPLQTFGFRLLNEYRDLLTEKVSDHGAKLLCGVLAAGKAMLSVELWPAAASGLGATDLHSVVWVASNQPLEQTVATHYIDQNSNQIPLMMNGGKVMDLEIMFLRMYLKNGLIYAPTIVVDTLDVVRYHVAMTLEENMSVSERETFTTLLKDAGEVNPSNFFELFNAAKQLES